MVSTRSQFQCDQDLERFFPECNWRTPLPVIWREWRDDHVVKLKRFACPFCLYRKGLLGAPGTHDRPKSQLRDRTPLYEFSEAVWKHLEMHHPMPT
jgi:hypothetical protein